MNWPKDDPMGRFAVEVELANYRDLIQAQAGQLDKKKVRRMRIRGTVDSGATRLVLPKKVADALGLSPVGDVRVRYADQRRATRKLVRDVWLGLMGREGIFDAVLEPKREELLIGAIVLETLDFVIDCTTQQLHPRDPHYIFSEIE